MHSRATVAFVTIVAWTLCSASQTPAPSSIALLKLSMSSSQQNGALIEGKRSNVEEQLKRSFKSIERQHINKHSQEIEQLQRQRDHPIWERNKNHSPANVPDAYLALCTIVRDNPALLHEWIMYHYTELNVKRFYIFDHNSTEPMLPMLMPLIKSGIVVYNYFTYIGWKGSQGSIQFWAYNQCARLWSEHHDWLAFMSIDEFLVVKPTGMPSSSPRPDRFNNLVRPKGPLEELLFEYEGASAIAVQKLVFSSTHEDRPPGVLGYYNRCMNGSAATVIASTYYLQQAAQSPSKYVYRNGGCVVDEQGGNVTLPSGSPLPTERTAVYHYMLRSRREWFSKLPQSSMWNVLHHRMMFETWNQRIHKNALQYGCSELDKYKDKYTRQFESKQEPHSIVKDEGLSDIVMALGMNAVAS